MKRITPFVLACLWLVPMSAQYFEIGTFTGVSNYAGDLSYDDYNYEATEFNLAVGLYSRINLSNMMALRGQVMYGKLTGSDRNGRTLAQRNRNLSFETDLFEISGQIELNLFGALGAPGNFSSHSKFARLCVIYINPKAIIGSELVELQGIETELDKNYDLVQLAIPLGLGFRYSVNEVGTLGFELGGRYTLTDYIDDVSGTYPDIAALRDSDPQAAQLSYRSPEIDPAFGSTLPSGTARGNSSITDWYLFAGITIGVNLTPPKKENVKTSYKRTQRKRKR